MAHPGNMKKINETDLTVEASIAHAYTLPADFYRKAELYELAKEQIFSKCWHWVADESDLPDNGYVYPFELLPAFLNEPLLLSKDMEGQVRCLSNVCTHRGKIMVEEAGKARQITCGYHGRCFQLDGTFKSMPGFQGVEDFPAKTDHLPPVQVQAWGNMLFASLDPFLPLEEILAPVTERIGFLPFEQLKFSETGTQDYPVNAHWALYVDNYLEGFHVPFVHPGLNKALDFGQYDYELFPYCNLQVGIADAHSPCFDLPPGHRDYGRRVFAYYFWVFPNLMLNFYPWGLSMNVVEPLGPEQTLVRFRAYTFERQESARENANIHQTEMEDEAVVESVQQGIKSRLYWKGRFSPSMEKCVHHFHRLVGGFLS